MGDYDRGGWGNQGGGGGYNQGGYDQGGGGFGGDRGGDRATRTGAPGGAEAVPEVAAVAVAEAASPT